MFANRIGQTFINFRVHYFIRLRFRSRHERNRAKVAGRWIRENFSRAGVWYLHRLTSETRRLSAESFVCISLWCCFARAWTFRWCCISVAATFRRFTEFIRRGESLSSGDRRRSVLRTLFSQPLIACISALQHYQRSVTATYTLVLQANRWCGNINRTWHQYFDNRTVFFSR